MARPKSIRASLPALRRLYRHCRPEVRRQRWLMSGSLLALLTEVIFRLLEPWPLKFAFDRLLRRDGAGATGDSPALLGWAALALVSILALRAVGSYYSAVGFARAGNKIVGGLRNRLYRHLQSLPIAFHSGARAGDLVIRLISDVGLLRDMAVTALLPLLAKCLILVGMIGVMLWMNWRLALVALLVLPFFALRTVSLGTKIREIARIQRARDSAMASSAAEALHGIRTVQALSLEERFAQAFGGANEHSAKADVKGKRLAASLERSVDVLIGIATGLTLWYGGILVWRGELTPGQLLVFLAYLKYAYRPVQDIAKYSSRLAKASASSARVLDLLERVPEVADRPDAGPAPAFRGDIHFDRISFSYDSAGGQANIWRDLDARIPAGTHLAIVGPSGSGKSTLAGLALRLHDPQAGCVRIDGEDIRQFTLASLRQQFAVVLDDTVLFAASVRENIAAAAPGASPDAIEAAARLANAHEFIRALPQGYDTVLGERGVTLSRGQRQRLAIARAALRPAPILLLDEPATGLDRANASLVLDALTRLESRRTVIHITHQPRHAAQSDLIWFVEHGRIVESGTHLELLARGGHYAALWQVASEEAADETSNPVVAENLVPLEENHAALS